jgi:hypothetical protein
MHHKVWGFLPFVLALAGLTACSSLFDGSDLKIQAVGDKSGSGAPLYDSLYESAKTAISARDYARALDYLQEARAHDAHNISVLNALGVVYDKLGRFDLSARYYAQARAADPQSRIVAQNMSYSNILQGLQNPGLPKAVASAQTPAGPAVPQNRQVAALPLQMPSVDRIDEVKPAAQRNLSVAGKMPQPTIVAAIVKPNVMDKRSPVQPVLKAVSPVAVPQISARLGAISAGKRPFIQTVTVLAAVEKSGISTPSVNRKVVTIGHPLKIMNASGRADGAAVLSRRLSILGWTVRPSETGYSLSATTLFYPIQNKIAAQAMQHTLPFAVRLVPDLAPGAAMRLVIGRDYLAWTPQNARMAALWQKGSVIASLSRPPFKGERQ